MLRASTPSCPHRGDAMSKFTFDKFKGGGGGRSPPALPSFRFHKSAEDLEMVEEEEALEAPILHADLEPRDRADSTSSTSAQSSQNEPGLDPLARDVSPMKERILCKFAKLVPDSGSFPSNQGELSEDHKESSSWIRQVKGRLTKKVQDSSLERAGPPPPPTEQQPLSLDLNFHSVEVVRRMSHSHSDMGLLRDRDVVAGDENQPRPQSQIFDLDLSDWSLDMSVASLSQETQETATQSSGITDGTLSRSPPSSSRPAPPPPPPPPLLPADPSDNSKAPESLLLAETPTKSRKRFVIPFLDRSGSVSGSPTKSENCDTPRRSFRALMKSYVTKTPQQQQEDKTPVASPTTPFAAGDPFSGLEFFDATSQDVPESEVDMSGFLIEEAVEAEDLIYSPEPKPEHVEENPVAVAEPPVLHTNSLSDLVNPVLVGIFIVVNFTGLFPSWLSGFLSGFIVATLLSIWLLLRLYPPISYSRTPRPVYAGQIAIHEPSPLVQAWMNLLPQQFHPYHVDTYEVKNTISVRVTIEHQMLKIEYPECNIPKRLNFDEVIPSDLKFHFHTDHIDLTTAKISLLPEGIAGKRMFSKKYPIEIRPNGARPPEGSVGSPLHKIITAQQPVARRIKPERRESLPRRRPDFLGCPLDSEGEEDSLADVDEGLDDDSPLDGFEGDKKVFYLFARADREKEDMYKALVDGHFFLADTYLDATRRQAASSDSRRETVRERKAKFSQYMSQILEQLSPSSSGPDSTPDAQLAQGDGCINFFNIFLHRIFYDIHKSEEMKTWLKSRIYNKLLKIKITQWFKQINLTEIHIGSNLPKILSVSRPTQNDRGLWVELGVEYRGLASATIETCGLNLGEEQVEAGAVHLKDLLEEKQDALHILPVSPGTDRKISSRIEAATNSEEEDSAESDSEESGEAAVGGLGPILVTSGPQAEQQAMPRPRWWEVVGNSELVKSGINRLSNTEWWKEKTSKKMTLQLEITSLKGIVVLNIASPPTDRLWYGFKSRPEIGLRILPYYGDTKLGEDNTFFSTAVNKGIEVLVNRLKEEIHKFILLPNMDDLPIRLMTALPATNVDQQTTTK